MHNICEASLIVLVILGAVVTGVFILATAAIYLIRYIDWLVKVTK